MYTAMEEGGVRTNCKSPDRVAFLTLLRGHLPRAPLRLRMYPSCDVSGYDTRWAVMLDWRLRELSCDGNEHAQQQSA